MIDSAIIEQKPLELVVAWLHHQLQADPAALDPAAMALLARRLIAVEVAPGGPYRDEKGAIDEELNRSIGRLFASIGIPLPGLEKYLEKMGNEERQGFVERTADKPTRALNSAQQQALEIVDGYRQPLQAPAIKVLSRILGTDCTGEISQLATMFVEPGGYSESDATSLGAANLLIWAAYTIFDGIIDGASDGSHLPAAASMHRDALTILRDHAPQNFRGQLEHILRGMDEANAWELAHCRLAVREDMICVKKLPRYGTYGLLAKRSAAHVLGPLILAARNGHSKRTLIELRRALYDYLIARQFNDDLHDWVEDVRKGHISPVVASLLYSTKIRAGEQSLSDTVQAMRKEFWNTGLNSFSDVALSFAYRSEVRLSKVGIAEPSSLFSLTILGPLQESLKRGIEHHARDKVFYETYRLRPAK